MDGSVPWASWIYLAGSLWGALWVVAALWPSKQGKVRFTGSFFMGWLTIELAPYHLVWQVGLTLVLAWFGAFEAWPGWVGLAVAVACWAALLGMVFQGRRTAETMRDAIADMAHEGAGPRIPWHLRYVPFARRRRDVVVERNRTFHKVAGKKIRLDVYRPRQAPRPGERRPAILQIHGGGWVIGDKREQGVPLLLHLVGGAGWVGFNANYRLAPGATFPDQLVDLKKALAWIREHADEYGVDPDFVAVTGGSAGGHLAALVALTANDPRYQPGFTDADTSVQAAVPFYGVYDFTNRNGTWEPDAFSLLLEPMVMKAFIAEEPEKFAEASPIDRVHADAPPFLVIHGDRDTLAPVEDARTFVEALRAVSRQVVLYAELAGAQHAFEIFPSIRANAAIEAVERFLAAVRHGALPPPAHAEEQLDEVLDAPVEHPPVTPVD